MPLNDCSPRCHRYLLRPQQKHELDYCSRPEEGDKGLECSVLKAPDQPASPRSGRLVQERWEEHRAAETEPRPYQDQEQSDQVQAVAQLNWEAG